MDREGKRARRSLQAPLDPDVSDAIQAFGVNAGIVEEIRDRFDADPASVDQSWAKQFGSYAIDRASGRLF